ncbi:hypothetical protein RvVAT039_pl05600 (plasmid) [Agrobacterium vitis]|nr:hypothetical protein RvVAT039_pl05600 [Agrobacterium vitis]
MAEICPTANVENARKTIPASITKDGSAVLMLVRAIVIFLSRRALPAVVDATLKSSRLHTGPREPAALKSDT